jgi:hypothetical protein
MIKKDTTQSEINKAKKIIYSNASINIKLGVLFALIVILVRLILDLRSNTKKIMDKFEVK